MTVLKRAEAALCTMIHEGKLNTPQGRSAWNVVQRARVRRGLSKPLSHYMTGHYPRERFGFSG